MSTPIIPLPWYKAENYQQLRDVLEDGNSLHDNYEEWLASALSLRQKIEKQGSKVVEVDICPVDFPQWCQDNGVNPNAAARSKYAEWYTSQMFDNQD